MKYFWMSFLILAGCSTAKITELPKTQVPPRAYDTVVLKNGLTLYFVPDASLPRIGFQAMVKAGSAQDPAGQEGVNDLVASLLDQGTKKHRSAQLSEQFNMLGTEFTGSTTGDCSLFGAGTISTEADRLFELFTEVLRTPAFDESEIQRQKEQIYSILRKRVDNPSVMAENAYEEFMFAANAYGHDSLGTEATVKALTRKDLVKYYETWYQPANILIAVSGRFDESFKKKVIANLESWEGKAVPERKPWPVQTPANTAPEVRLLAKSDLVQSQIRMGVPAVPRLHPDFIPLRLAAEILGGGSGARLMMRIRDELGLTYGIYSRADGRKNAGAFTVSTFTRNEAVTPTLHESFKLFEQFAAKGATEAELSMAKAQILGQFPRSIETPDAYAGQLLFINLYGLPKYYLDEYYNTIGAVTLGQVNSAIRAHLNKNNLKVVVYGPETLAAALKDYNPAVVPVQK